jgi:hypothetical protein
MMKFVLLEDRFQLPEPFLSGSSLNAGSRSHSCKTHTIALADPLLVTTGGPGLNKLKTESAASIDRWAGWPGLVTMTRWIAAAQRALS